MSAWPATRQWLEENGFSLLVRKRCAGSKCGMTIEFWLTPAGRRIPLNLANPQDQQSLQPHWEVCPNEKEFRAFGHSLPTPEKPAKAAKPVKQKAEKVQSGRLF